MARPKQYIADRLQKKVNAAESGCIEWQGHTLQGYGAIRDGERRVRLAHRVAFEAAKGPITDGLCVLHRCDNRRCVNVAHLFLGTRNDNNKDKTAKNRQARGPMHGLRGEGHPRSRLSLADVGHIRLGYGFGLTQRELAAIYSVSQSAISQIINRKRWA